ncbi:putative potassium transporter 12 isoform X2 [Phalaenopsis equestris]|uniref:putative potassium transporter 12 isoform X2 n=1 Tax=Phalaenopsis equestris TaxID=78828 RepID=UPI0009E58EDB|nr:putative potassium transporter 12 isoform X2 [Phalaenopsis equestris]
MEEEGIVEEAAAVRLMSSDSRWVDGSELEGEEKSAALLGFEEEAILRRRLWKKPKREDSLNVEAMIIAGSQGLRKKENLSAWSTIAMAFQTLGVVYGDMGTSPLYVFSDVFSKVPINSELDVLGALSLVLYTIALIPFAKYVFVVLKANDNGEGGTFALYSLICRYAKVSQLPNQQRADEDISSFRLKLPTTELERALKIKDCLEKNSCFKTLLLLLVLMGTSMIIGDGILTPSMSVLSAVSGLQGAITGINSDAVVILAIVILAVLFSIQSIGTGKVGFLFAPVLALWFFGIGSIGLYNIIKHDISVFRALNPAYIYFFFKRNNLKAWTALGGVVLCITEAFFWPIFVIATFAAMIASQAMISATFSCIKQSMALGCFPRMKIIHTSKRFMGQIYIPVMNWFLMVMCIIIVATFRRTTGIANAYGIAEVLVMLVSTTLVTLVMLLIWQTNLFLALSFPAIFGTIELIYLSAVLSKVLEGGWLPLAFASCFLFVMYVWNYGSVLKYRSEMREKISMDFITELGSSLGTVRVPGIGLVYNELVQGIPSIFGQLLVALPAVHSVIVFVCIKYVPVPIVPLTERFLFRRICRKEFHMFRCVARYGYKDVRKEDHHTFEQLLIESLEKFLRKEAKELALEMSPEETDADNGSLSPDVPELRVPLLSGKRMGGAKTAGVEDGSLIPSTSSPAAEDPSLDYELSALREGRESGFTYLLAQGDVRARKDSWFTKKLVINYFYSFLRRNCRAGAANMSVPHMHIIRVGMTYMV